MLYIIYSEDVENSLPLRAKAREGHIARLKHLQNEGRLIIAGPCPAIDSITPGDMGFTGSVIIAEFENLAQAQTWADTDPFLTEGVYKKVTVKPFKNVLPL